jgi:hypothetical protein
MVVFGGGCTIFLAHGFANRKESCTYDPVYDLGSKNTTKNTFNITFFGGGCLSFYLRMCTFLKESTKSVVFSDKHCDYCTLDFEV